MRTKGVTLDKGKRGVAKDKRERKRKTKDKDKQKE